MAIKGKVAQIFITLLLTAGMGAYAWGGARLYQAHRLAEQVDKRPALEKAVSLQPSSAAYHNTLCRYLVFEAQDPSGAVVQCKQATELDPHGSRYWIDLAQAYFVAGAENQQGDALRHAIAVDPTTPEVAWNAANFFLLQGDTAAALKQFAVVLRYDAPLVTPALDQCWRAVHDVDQIEGILPSDPKIYLEFVQLLATRDQAGAASRVWSAFLRLNREFDFHQALFYVDYLLNRREVAPAFAAWKELASHSAAMAPYLDPDDAVSDGEFSEEFLDSGFDWRYSGRSDVNVTLDTSDVHSGNRSLALTFSGSANDSGLYELVAVEPNLRYSLSAWVKSEELQTAFGLRVMASDPYNSTNYAMTDDTVGTTVWHRVAADFQTGPATRLLKIRFGRDSSGTQVQGRFWVDQVSLRPTSKLSAE
jgi:tetratricopeptide (TPR) repeat protein